MKMQYASKKDILKKLNKKVSMKHIKKQILDILEEVGDVSVREICSYFFQKSSIDMAVFFNTFIRPLVINDDIKLSNCKEDEVFCSGSDRILGNIILKLKESR